MKPSVSIILPAYNSAHLIARAIESVLAQSFTDWELLIIDDGSTDNTAAVADSYAAKLARNDTRSVSGGDQRIRVLQNSKNQGVQYTLARGLAEARGEFIARIDSDDAWLDREKLAQQLAFLDEHTDHVLVGTGAIISDEKGDELFRFLPPETDAQIRSRLLLKNCFMHASVLFKKSAAQQVGGYDQGEGTRHIEDYDLWLKLGTVGKLANLPLYGLLFTSRPAAISAQNRSAQFKKTIALIKKYQKQYPNYGRGIFIAYARYYLYALFSVLPAFLRHAILRRYKGF